jgi:hypothetical protein
MLKHEIQDEQHEETISFSLSTGSHQQSRFSQMIGHQSSCQRIYTGLLFTHPPSPMRSNTPTSDADSSHSQRKRKPRFQPASHNYEATKPSDKPERRTRRDVAWTKARAQQARNKQMRKDTDSEVSEEPRHEVRAPIHAMMNHIGPKRRRAAFVKDEELNCMLEDRAGTPHISELQHDEDVFTSLSVEELGLAGDVESMVDCGSNPDVGHGCLDVGRNIVC